MAQPGLIQELESAVSQGSAASRAAALSYATDLLIAGRYSDDDTWVFGEVIGLLASEIEASARAQLADRLAHFDRAPSNIVDRLASDAAIQVAGPVLRHSDRISADALARNARTQSQDHLLAISQRKSLNEDVTDVLVTRGNRTVVQSVARNEGARLSDSGFWQLVHRCENDVVLTLEVGARKDIPRHHFQKLIARASDEVKAKLASVNPRRADEISHVVTDVTGSLQEKFGPATRSYFAAKRQVGAMQRAGQLNEEVLRRFVRERRTEEAAVALSLLCDLPVNVVDRAMHSNDADILVILAKAGGFAWETARLLVLLCVEGGVSEHDLEQAHKSFSQLSVATAQQVRKFYWSRQDAGTSPAATLPALHRA